MPRLTPLSQLPAQTPVHWEPIGFSGCPPGGENIYPREIEEVLYRLPGVRECHVLGTPDPNWGQAVTAFVVTNDPALCAEKVVEFCKQSPDLAAFKRPKKICFLDALPRNPSGKVVKAELLARLDAREAPGSAHDK